MSDSAPAGPATKAARAGAAFFDLDKTVIARASMSAFREPLYSGGLLTRRALLRAVFAQLVYLHLGASEQGLARLRSSVLKLARGWQQEQVREIVEEALERIVEPIIFAEAMDLIDLHRIEGRRVVIVSAAPEEIVTPLGRHLGIDEVIASSAEVDDEGLYTGEMAFYAYGTQKAEAMRAYAEESGIDLLRSYAYSDAHSDLPMLELVGHPVVVNPDRELAHLARERGWEVRHFVRPIRLRDRFRDRVRNLSPRPGITWSAGALALCAGGVALSWWVGRKRALFGPVRVLKPPTVGTRRGFDVPRSVRARSGQPG